MILSLIIFVCVVFGTGAHSDIPEELRRDFFKIYKGLTIDVEDVTGRKVTPDQVTFTLFQPKNIDQGTVLTSSDLSLVAPTTGRIFFIIHGWTHSANKTWVLNMKNAFLTEYPDSSVITVDWSKPARQIYYISALDTYDIGNLVGNLMLELVNDHNVDIKKFLCVGHSLGGQICGFTGKKVQSAGKMLSRIFALDPAGPLFTERPENKRLNPNDAEVVEVLHTNGGVFGFKEPCGTIDFFANGGSSQPGCLKIDAVDHDGIKELVSCDHERAFKYFTEAIKNPLRFVSTLCTEYKSWRNICHPKIKVPLGNLRTTLIGHFYFETNKRSPYSKTKLEVLLDGASNILKSFANMV